MQIVHLHERDSGGVVYPAHNGSVITRWQAGDDCGFVWVGRSVAAVLYFLDLVLRDDAADDCLPPVIVGGNQSSCAVVQLQGRISQEVQNTMLAELRSNGTYDY